CRRRFRRGALPAASDGARRYWSTRWSKRTPSLRAASPTRRKSTGWCTWITRRGCPRGTSSRSRSPMPPATTSSGAWSGHQAPEPGVERNARLPTGRGEVLDHGRVPAVHQGDGFERVFALLAFLAPPRLFRDSELLGLSRHGEPASKARPDARESSGRN